MIETAYKTTSISQREKQIYLHLPHLIFGNKVVIENHLENYKSATVAFRPDIKELIITLYHERGEGGNKFSFTSHESKRKRIAVRQLLTLFNMPFQDGQLFDMAWQSERVIVLSPVIVEEE